MKTAKMGLALFVLLLTGTVARRACAQTSVVSTARVDSDVRSILAQIAAEDSRPVRVSSAATGRLESQRLSVVGDSAFLETDSGTRAIAIMNVDSIWTQRGTAAQLIGVIAAVPCAIYGAMVGSFIGGDPDSNGSPRRETLLGLAGIAAGAVICGSIGAAVGSTITRWRLEFPRPIARDDSH